MANNTITVFEHSKLGCREQGLGESHFKALVKFNELHGNKYFTVGFQKITFGSYVGVIQVGGKVIEILPKADKLSDKQETTKKKWQTALLHMLRSAGCIKLNNTEKAQQQQQHDSLLDIYLYAFMDEVQSLIHSGLIKKYQRVQRNSPALKGKLMIEKQIQFNSIHKERFFVEHTVYDRDNIYNAILAAALEIVQKTSVNYSIKRRAASHLLSFEGIGRWSGQPADFDKLSFDRKTESYRYAVELARMILLHYNPGMAAGNRPVLAILFKMSSLFESFIYRELKREERNYTEYRLQVLPQRTQVFWMDKTIRPDVVISYKHRGEDQTVVVDTKWKIVSPGNPSDEDLKQMFAYNFQFGSRQGILFYPRVGQEQPITGDYPESKAAPSHRHGCEMYFCRLFCEDQQSINKAIGKDLFEHILSNAAKKQE